MDTQRRLLALAVAAVVASPFAHAKGSGAAAPEGKPPLEVAGMAKAQAERDTGPSAGKSWQAKAAPGGGPGKVWVDTQARVYHCGDDPLYGRTRKGTYMTEARARATGARALMDRACS